MDKTCSWCSGALTRSKFTPDQPADSDLCAACWYNNHHNLALISLDELDELLDGLDTYDNKLITRAVQGGLVDWHGDIGQFTEVEGVLRIAVTLLCNRCGGSPMQVTAGSGLHSGAWPYIYNLENEMLGNIRDGEYICETCTAEREAAKR